MEENGAASTDALPEIGGVEKTHSFREDESELASFSGLTQLAVRKRLNLIDSLLNAQPVDLDELHSISRSQGEFVRLELCF
jgi:hypothetical protein